MSFLLQHYETGREKLRICKGDSLRIGRGTNNDLRFEDPGVELEHAVIEKDDEGYVLRNVSKLRGTWVNERRLSGEHRLANGDRITIATFSLEAGFLDPEAPLALSVKRLEETLDESTTIASRNLRELIDLEEGHSSELVATLPTVLGRDLVVLAERERAREQALAEQTKTEDFAVPEGDEPRADDAADTRPVASTAEPRPAVAEPRPAAAADVPAAAGRVTEAGAAVPPPPRVDYVRSYGLQRGFLHTSLLAVVFSLVAAGTLFALVKSRSWGAFSPGELATKHQQIDQAADSCQACHAGWLQVQDESCSGACHATVGEHQTFQAAAPDCVECHTEHRGDGGLLFAAGGSCVDCHGALGSQVLGMSRFEAAITDFAPGDHPEFKLAVIEDGVVERRPLTEPGVRTADPGGIRGFDHDWHLHRLPPHVETLVCRDCHRAGPEGEILPLRFEESCQKCHNLAFDARFAGQQAPHDEPAEVLIQLTGRYVLRPELLRRLTPGERNRLARRRLSEVLQLRDLARDNAERLVWNVCVKCHHFAPGNTRRSPLEEVEVRPAGIRQRWLQHARFLHGPHVELGIACVECHQGASASQDTSDVLVPGIDVCFECHRPVQPGEEALEKLGRTACSSCHGYHPEPGEETFVLIGEGGPATG